MKRKFLALIMVLVLVATVLSACGGEKKKEESSEEQSNSETTSEGGESQESSENTEADESSNSEQPESESKEQGDSSGAVDTEKVKAELKERFTLAYYGQGNEGEEFYWAFAPGVKSGMLLVVSADKSQSMFFIGSIEEVDTDWMIITDEKSGSQLKFKVEKVSDNPEDGIRLTSESNNQAVLVGMPADKIIDTMFEITAQ